MESIFLLILLALVALIIGGLGKKSKDSRPAPTVPRTASDSSLDQSGPDHRRAKVRQIIDGDTVIVTVGLRRETLRLDAIDCPENGQYWGDTAKYGLVKLIGGRGIRFQGHGKDKYGRTLATIFVFDDSKREWINVNARMVLRGHAWVSRLLCNHLPREQQDELLKMQRWARRKRVGLWRDPNPIPPWKWRNGDNTSP